MKKNKLCSVFFLIFLSSNIFPAEHRTKKQKIAPNEEHTNSINVNLQEIISLTVQIDSDEKLLSDLRQRPRTLYKDLNRKKTIGDLRVLHNKRKELVATLSFDDYEKYLNYRFPGALYVDPVPLLMECRRIPFDIALHIRSFYFASKKQEYSYAHKNSPPYQHYFNPKTDIDFITFSDKPIYQSGFHTIAVPSSREDYRQLSSLRFESQEQLQKIRMLALRFLKIPPSKQELEQLKADPQFSGSTLLLLQRGELFSFPNTDKTNL